MYSKARLIISFFVLLLSNPLTYSQDSDKDISAQGKELIESQQYEEAFNLYKQAILDAEADFFKEYKGEVQSMYDKYEITEQELENQIQSTRNNKLEVFVSFFVLILLIIVFYIIYKNNKKLKKSNEELKNATSILNHSLNNKSLFLSNTSHEIRTPLNALIGFSKLLSEEDITHEEALEYNEIIKLNAELLMRLIDDVIDISCLDIYKLKFELKPVEVVSLSKQIIETIIRIKKTDVNVNFKCEEESITILSDMARLQQIIINLLSNALKFCTKGNITLEIERKDKMLYFSVSDTGIGIPKDKQKDLFERFIKVNEHSNGTGLGLSISKITINRLGGDIFLDSEYKNGAKFVFTHPINN